jgi:hypothetical protein
VVVGVSPCVDVDSDETNLIASPPSHIGAIGGTGA